jgi:hypothetical protein
VPDDPIFSTNPHGRVHDSGLLGELFETAVRCCIAEGLVGCDGSATDGSLIRADIDFKDRPLVGLLETFHKTHRMSEKGQIRWFR